MRIPAHRLVQRSVRCFAPVFALATTLGAVPFVPSGLDGYAPASVPIERRFEATFRDVPSAEGAIEEAQRIDEQPHYAGSVGDYRLATYMRDRFREFGLDATLETFRTRVDRPKRLLVQLIIPAPLPTPGRRARAPKPMVTTLDLRERGAPYDPAQHGDPGLPFNAGSADGDVTAPIVYAHRGIEEDYERLASFGIDVRRAIVLVRYGAQFRGLLAERAQAHGAAAVLFYSDPIDDGGTRGATYPDGPWRPSGAVQRGSVGANVTIPTLPISADNARLLLASLQGVPVLRQASAANGAAGNASAANASTTSGAPANVPQTSRWTGGLDVPYPYARGPGLARVSVKLDRPTLTLWNTVARIRGTTQAEQLVVLGAHRDAWVRGVTDNGSGITTMLEIGRGLGYLARAGWKPRRTIVLAGWDAEEIGLRGSQAFVTAHRAELERGGVAYINADEDISGPTFGASAVGVLGDVVTGATQDVSDPGPGKRTVRERWGASALVGAPGGGSDHESFLSGLGTPVAELGFHGPLGTYHSVYDDFRNARTFIDPDFSLHRTMSQIDGMLAMRIADADILPYRFRSYADAMQRQLTALVAPNPRRVAATLDPSPLQSALAGFTVAVERADAATERGRADPGTTDIAYTRQQLAAARILDAYYYRIDGYRGSVLGSLDTAATNGDFAQIQNAIREASEALNRATEALTIP